MSTASEMAERHATILGELSQLGLALARDVQARALAADDAAAGELTLAFQRASRSVRQSLALEARLAREQKMAERQETEQAAKAALTALQGRKSQVRHAVTRLIWDEAEGEAAESLEEALEFALAEASDETFAQDAVEAVIERLREELGLSSASADDDGAEPGAAPDVVIWRSSG